MDTLQTLLMTLLLSFVINIAMFLLAFWFRTDKLTDISYAVTFITLAVLALLSSPAAFETKLLLVALITIWAIRLGGFLLIRIWKTGVDHRFDDMRGNFLKFGRFWMLQALSVWVILLPSLLAFSQPVFSLSGISYCGVAVWLVGLLIESIADVQKYKFSQNPANKKVWISSGIWKYSRHPNYFGEMLVWTGLYLVVLPVLPPLQALIALIGPLFIVSLLLFVSGIPPLEKSADKRWGSNPDYQLYKQKTSILIPLPPKK